MNKISKNFLYHAILSKLNSMSELKRSVIMYSYNFQHNKNIKNKYDLADTLVNDWYYDNITLNECIDKWNSFYKYHYDVDGLLFYLEDENGYLK